MDKNDKKPIIDAHGISHSSFSIPYEGRSWHLHINNGPLNISSFPEIQGIWADCVIEVITQKFPQVQLKICNDTWLSSHLTVRTSHASALELQWFHLGTGGGLSGATMTLLQTTLLLGCARNEDYSRKWGLHLEYYAEEERIWVVEQSSTLKCCPCNH